MTFGNTNTSLINQVNIHELNHVVRLTAPTDDGLADFLVNDTTNVDAPARHRLFERRLDLPGHLHHQRRDQRRAVRQATRISR